MHLVNFGRLICRFSKVKLHTSVCVLQSPHPPSMGRGRDAVHLWKLSHNLSDRCSLLLEVLVM